jgi:hypothetical protein
VEIRKAPREPLGVSKSRALRKDHRQEKHFLNSGHGFSAQFLPVFLISILKLSPVNPFDFPSGRF